MTAKLQSKISAWVAGLSGFIAWLVSLPPQNQDAVIKPLIELTPLDWRPTIGLVMRGLSTASLIYGAYKMHATSIQPPEDKPK